MSKMVHTVVPRKHESTNDRRPWILMTVDHQHDMDPPLFPFSWTCLKKSRRKFGGHGYQDRVPFIAESDLTGFIVAMYQTFADNIKDMCTMYRPCIIVC